MAFGEIAVEKHHILFIWLHNKAITHTRLLFKDNNGMPLFLQFTKDFTYGWHDCFYSNDVHKDSYSRDTT